MSFDFEEPYASGESLFSKSMMCLEKDFMKSFEAPLPPELFLKMLPGEYNDKPSEMMFFEWGHFKW